MQFQPLQIYHEHQSSQLCARHCLNNLLQGPYFTEFDLSKIALDLDKEEQALLAQDGDSGLVEWLKQNKQSQNVSDDGNFSIQVLRRALDNLSLKIYHFGHKDVSGAQQHPEHEQGFICNLQAHWFAIRRIGGQWYNLNSLSGLPETKAKPTTISNFYLSAFLSSLTNDGYSIFVVRSDNWPHLHSYDPQQLLPPYAKWYVAPEVKARADTYPKHLLDQVNQSRNGQNVTSLGWGDTNNNMNQDDMLQFALQESAQDADPNMYDMRQQDPELAHALALSMQQNNGNNNNHNTKQEEAVNDAEELEDEDVLLQQALAMSMMKDNNEEDQQQEMNDNDQDMEDNKDIVSEPDESEEDCCSIQLRLPQNKRIERRFKIQHTLRDVAVFVKSQDASFNDIVFVCPPMHSYHDKELTLDAICKELNSKKLAFIVKENENKDAKQ
eukprot:18311_1